MKKWLVLALVVCVVSAVQAGEGEKKNEYVKKKMQWAEKDPQWNPTKADLEAQFDELDTDGNGKLTDAEKQAGKNGKKGKKGGTLTKQEFVKERMAWAKQDPQWNPTKAQLETKFDELDTNGDGKLTPKEKG